MIQETADHLLYPNPGSGLIHEQHLQFFHFLGTLLAKVFFLLLMLLFMKCHLSLFRRQNIPEGIIKQALGTEKANH